MDKKQLAFARTSLILANNFSPLSKALGFLGIAHIGFNFRMKNLVIIIFFTMLLQSCFKQGEWSEGRLVNPFTDEETFVALTDDNKRRIYCDINVGTEKNVIFNLYLLIKSNKFPASIIDVRFGDYEAVQTMSYYDDVNGYGIIAFPDMKNFHELIKSNKVVFQFLGKPPETFNLAGSQTSLISACKSEAALNGLNFNIDVK